MSVDSASWAGIVPYLDRALELEPDELVPWLDQLEAKQARLAKSLRELLAERDALNERSFMSSPPLSVSRLDTILPALEQALSKHQLAQRQEHAGIVAGAVLGPYRLLREIGHGGMSCVWLAKRCDGHFAREVAIKLPFAGPPQARMAEHFQREREILAALTHPNIARLYDAGVSAAGQSYLAMEYVSGTALDLHCDSNTLTIRERLDLFLQVLGAVGFAHSHLVLHRDLKPSNIQVTAEGRVVLLDFGIAKLLSPEASDDPVVTELATRMLTPGYASPEQIAGSALCAMSDVYSLGVVLFELLVGERPFGAKSNSRRELEEAILTQDPPRPSQFVAAETRAAARSTTPRKLAQTLQGDLETIVLKALKKVPEQRYPSIDAFAQDIRNYLADLPVGARPDSSWYRARRFVSRNKWQVAATVVTSLSIVAGAGAAVWQAREATQQRDRALALASRNRAINEFTSMLIGEAASSDRPVTVKQMLLRSENLAQTGTVGSEDDRAAVLEMIANFYVAAGDSGKALQVLERALSLVENAIDVQLKSRLTCLHATMIGDAGRIEAAVTDIKRELAQLNSDPETASFCLNSLANVSLRAGDADGTLRYGLQALERFRSGARSAPADEAELLGTVGYGYRLNRNNALANRYYGQALQKYIDVGREQSPNALMMLNNWGLVSTSSGEPKRALEIYDRILGTLQARDPDASPPPALIFNRARALESIGRFAEAEAGYQRALQLGRETNNIAAEGLALAALASVSEQSGDRTAAVRYLRQLDERLGESISSYAAMAARRAMVQGRLAVAEGHFARARALFDGVLDAGRNSVWKDEVLLSQAELELLAGDAAAALAIARSALDGAVARQGGLPYSHNAGRAWLMIGRALQATGEMAAAHDAFVAATDQLASTVDAVHPALIRARELLAEK